MKEAVISRILETLDKNRSGMTIQDIAENVSINRVTASKYLEALSAKGEVEYRKIGVYRLWFTKKAMDDTVSKVVNIIDLSLLRALTDSIDFSPSLIKSIGTRMGKYSAHLFTTPDVPISSMKELMEIIAMQEEMSGVTTEILKTSMFNGVIRITKPEEYHGISMNWYQEAEVYAWQQIFKEQGVTDIKVLLRENTDTYYDIEVKIDIIGT